MPVVGRARVYVCGITPYDTTHLGHAATFVWGDLAARVLRHAGVDVEVCRNVTDVDDVLDAAAARAGARFDSFAAVQQFRFDRDMAALGVRRPTHEPRAHNHVAQVVALAEALLEAGAAYERGGSVWFRGADVPARVGLDAATARGLAREFGEQLDDVGTPAGRDHWADVAVWRAAGPGAGTTEPAWPSPWGEGRPGLARRVRGDGADDLRAGAGPARRRRGPALPAPRLRGGDGRGGHGRDPVRAGVAARRDRAGGRGEDGEVGRQPRAGVRRRREPPAGGAAAAADRPAVGAAVGLRARGPRRGRGRLERLYAAAARGTRRVGVGVAGASRPRCRRTSTCRPRSPWPRRTAARRPAWRCRCSA